MGGQFSYQKLEQKYGVHEITFDVLKLTDDEHQRFINPVITKNCQLHSKICLSIYEAQEQYISNKLINCPCGAKVKRLGDLRKDIRWIINEQFHQSTEEVQLIQGLFAHKYYRSQEFIDSLEQANDVMPNFLQKIITNYNNYWDQVKEKINQESKFLARCLKDKVKLIIPVRIIECKHLECYELTSLLHYQKQQQERKNKKYLKCSHPKCNVMLNIQTLENMTSNLMLDSPFLKILNKSSPNQIQFCLKNQAETNFQENVLEPEIDPLIQSSYDNRVIYEQDIKTHEQLRDFQFLIQKEVSEVLQGKHDKKSQKLLKLRFFQIDTISLKDQLTDQVMETPVRCKYCTDLTKSLDIKSYAATYLAARYYYKCYLCNYEWDCNLKLSNVIYIDEVLLDALSQKNYTKKEESFNYDLNGKQLLLNQIKKKQVLSRKSFLRLLQTTFNSTIVKPQIQTQVKLPLVRKNYPFQSVIDYDIFYEGLKEHFENQENKPEEIFEKLINDSVSQVYIHRSYQDIIKVLQQNNFRESSCLYDFRKRYFIFKEENCIQILIVKNRKINALSFFFDGENKKCKFLIENVGVENIIIELFKNDGRIITDNPENGEGFEIYQGESLYLYFLKNKIVFKLNECHENKKNMEKKILEQFETTLGVIQFIVYSLKQDHGHCLLVYNQLSDRLTFILKYLNSISEKVQILKINFEIKELKQESDFQSEEQFQNKFQVKVLEALSFIIILGEQEKLNIFTKLIIKIQERKRFQFKKQIIELDNEMRKHENLFKIGENRRLLYQLATECSIVNVFDAIKLMVWNINIQEFVLHCLLTEDQKRYLQDKFQYEISQIQKSFSCQIQFSEKITKPSYYLEIKYSNQPISYAGYSKLQKIDERIMIWKITNNFQGNSSSTSKSGYHKNSQFSYLKYFFFYAQEKESLAFDFRNFSDDFYKKGKREIFEFIFDFISKGEQTLKNLFFIENSEQNVEESRLIASEYLTNFNNILSDSQNDQRQQFLIIKHNQIQLLQQTSTALYQKELTIQSQSKINIELARIEIDKILDTIEVTIRNPYLFKGENEIFASIIQKYIRKSINDKEITFKINSQQQRFFALETNCFVNHQNQYPQNWTRYYYNFNKVSLNKTDSEYRMVEQNFKKTDNGNIYRIYRIQNKQLWENYMFDKNKLIQSYKNLGQELTNLEKERYLWHGVRGQHPEIIYKGDREGFDSTYANSGGSYGGGIYFSEKANYSRGYSFVLNGNQDQDLRGSRVFLYCLVTTGKLQTIGSNSSIRRPNQGYDCITDGGDMFILYAMDARRAYPAYEVIFQ